MTGTATRVRSINVVQLGLMWGVISALLGVLLGLFLAFAFMVSPAMPSATGMPNIGPLAIVLFPILYGVEIQLEPTAH